MNLYACTEKFLWGGGTDYMDPTRYVLAYNIN